MKLTITQPALADLIARGGATAPKKSPLPILEHFRLTATDDALALASSDMDRFAEATTAASVETPGALLVPSAAFKTLIAKHPKSAEVSIEAGDGFLLVKAGRSKVRLPTMDAADFPTWADETPTSEFDMAGEDFERSLSRVRFAASDSQAHVYLQGVCIDVVPDEKVLHFVATDTHRLALSGIPMPEGAANCPRVIVPSETVDAALAVFKGAGKVHVTVSDKAVGFAADSLRLSGRLIAMNFPDYQRIIPSRGAHPTASFERAEFVTCLERANVLVGEGSYASIAFEPGEGEIALLASNHKGGMASEALPGEFDGEFQKFHFSPQYAASFLGTLNVKRLTIEQSSPRGAHLIFSQDAPDFLGLLMPVNK